MNCERYDGEQEFQIYVNEGEGYVLYNADTVDSNDREQDYKVTYDGETRIEKLDAGLDIYLNTDQLIQAGNKSNSFIFAKETSTYAYAWTMPLTTSDGEQTAFGNHHSGECSVSPFPSPN